MTISPFCLGSKTRSPWPKARCSSSNLKSQALVILLRRINNARSLALAEEMGFEAGLGSSRAESRPIRWRPLWWWSQPQSEDAGEVDAEVYVVDGEDRGVLEANERAEEIDELGDGLRAVLRRRSPVVRRADGVNGWKRDEVRMLMGCGGDWIKVASLIGMMVIILGGGFEYKFVKTVRIFGWIQICLYLFKALYHRPSKIFYQIWWSLFPRTSGFF